MMILVFLFFRFLSAGWGKGKSSHLDHIWKFQSTSGIFPQNGISLQFPKATAESKWTMESTSFFIKILKSALWNWIQRAETGSFGVTKEVVMMFSSPLSFQAFFLTAWLGAKEELFNGCYSGWANQRRPENITNSSNQILLLVTIWAHP